MIHAHRSAAAVCLLALLLACSASCGDGADKSDASAAASARGTSGATAVCERAFVRYSDCIGETLGKEMGNMARQKKDIPGCVKEPMTVTMYETCLPKATCSEFLGCMDEFVQKGPPR